MGGSGYQHGKRSVITESQRSVIAESEHEGLTRISVRSSRDYYIVRHGGGPEVRVRRRGRSLECECGEHECAHVRSLRLCGFVEVEDTRHMPMAA
jgi:hypothetical protein